MYYLESFPSWLIVFMFMTSAVLMSIMIVYFIKFVFPIRYSDALSITVKSLITFRLIGAVSLILGFAIVMSNTAYQTSIMNVAEEAHQIERISNAIGIMNEESRNEIREKLINYTKSIVKNEWANMSYSDSYNGDPITKKYLHELFRSINAAQLRTENNNINFREIYLAEEQAEILRQRRLTNAHQEIPSIFWGIAFTFFLIINCLGALLEIDNVHHNLLFVTVTSSVIGLLAGFLLIMSHPFSGNVSVTAHPIEEVIKTLEMNR